MDEIIEANKKVQKERDALLAIVNEWEPCKYCKHCEIYNGKFNRCVVETECKFEWKGLEE